MKNVDQELVVITRWKSLGFHSRTIVLFTIVLVFLLLLFCLFKPDNAAWHKNNDSIIIGFGLDVLLFGLIISWLQNKHDKKQQLRKFEDDLEDYRTLPAFQQKQRVARLIPRSINDLGLTPRISACEIGEIDISLNTPKLIKSIIFTDVKVQDAYVKDKKISFLELSRLHGSRLGVRYSVIDKIRLILAPDLPGEPTSDLWFERCIINGGDIFMQERSDATRLDAYHYMSPLFVFDRVVFRGVNFIGVAEEDVKITFTSRTVDKKEPVSFSFLRTRYNACVFINCKFTDEQKAELTYQNKSGGVWRGGSLKDYPNVLLPLNDKSFSESNFPFKECFDFRHGDDESPYNGHFDF